MPSNQMIPFDQLNQLQRGCYPDGTHQLLHNTGSVYFDRETHPNVAIYNASGGIINVISSGSGSGRHYCDEHKMRFDSWQEHIKSFNHRFCPLPGCQKSRVDFGTFHRFYQHWQNKHRG